MNDLSGNFKQLFKLSPEDLKNLNFQRFFRLVGKALATRNNLILFGALYILIFPVGNDFLLQPALKNLNQIGKTLETQKKSLQSKEEEQTHFQTLLQQVKELPVHILELKPGQSSRVMALRQSQQIVDTAKNLEQNSAQDSTSDSGKRSEQKSNKDSEASNAANPDQNNPPSAENPSSKNLLPANELKFIGNDIVSEAKLNIVEGDANLTPVYLSRFIYKLNLEGTYGGLAAMLNKIVLMPEMVSIDRIEISKAESKDPQEDPDPLQNPDGIVTVKMEVIYSIYIHEAQS